ncbi:MAG: GNAT family N-acetyltransferase [Proteobacteria bacterium]|nr:GNAT family N-acetyltransferase [Pseudomonadota bacterium]
MEMIVEQLRRDQDSELTAFLDTLGAGSVPVLGYHYPYYRDMLEAIGVGEPHYLGARRNGTLIGCLPAFQKKSPAGTVISSLPFFGPNGGVLCAPEQAEAIHAVLLAAIVEHARGADALSCSIYTPFQLPDFGLYDRALSGWPVVEKFTQYQSLGDSRDQSVTWSLRKAQRLGVTVSTELTPERLDGFYAIYTQNCRDYGIPLKPRACVDFLTTPEMLRTRTRIYFALHENKVLGGLLMVWSPAVASYYIPCSLSEARNMQPGTMLIDAAMRDAHAAGLRLWNWESSPSRDSGVYKFKKNWGGTIERAYRIYVQSFAGEDRIRTLGRDGIAREFPYFFVWPFDRL